jgi:hypothetical protein
MADQKLDGIDDLFATQFGMLVLTDEEVHRAVLLFLFIYTTL